MSWAAAGVFTIVDIRNIIYKSRLIDLYRKKQSSKVDDFTTGHHKNDLLNNNKQKNPQPSCSKDTTENVKLPEEADEKKTKKQMVGDAIKGYFTDPFLDKTICKPAEKLRDYAEFLRQQETLISENETIQLLLNNENE